MIKNLFVTGDTHGNVLSRFERFMNTYNPEDTAFIILGDAGLNFYLNKSEYEKKKELNEKGFRIYCVRGNHEERPKNLNNLIYIYDQEIKGTVIYEPNYHNIRYLIDGLIYTINGHRTLVIGGAYSVDKYWRLERARYSGSSFTGWFPEEQLNEDEMKEISEGIKGQHVDYVLSHTCPYSWMPTDLFLNCVDQSTVDNTMEKWMEELKDTFDWEVWLFGHYHSDRYVRPGVEMLFTDVIPFEDPFTRWIDGRYNPSLMDPKFYERR